METLYKKAKVVSFFTVLLVFLQSCDTYEKVPMSLDEAVTANKKVKVITADKKTHKFKKIQMSDGTYYGLTEVRDQIVKTPMHKNEIQSINSVDNTASADATRGTAKIALVVLYVMGITTTP
ncbi:hypothetical protein FLJC2902T_00580 [Flavobacterium limnosediminis JC2902]|uniref:Uncharacterized protein n=1 Tax=Flavobacterium limnosediminis JC2902 TaxID=1341181 RepID=V6ST16_9FLAO|nr:hypothetical protein [Flavobacterium limnosediminis]ESU29589.1 hypothetical protein FLJC2902T_00580 [Flavobacterium limnosediminis JC2902]